MTVNPYERAVIEAARILHDEGSPDDWAGCAVVVAMGKLIAYEASLAPGVREIDWHEVTEGDDLLGSDGATFRPVLRTLRVRGGKYEITVALNTRPKTLTRPTEKEPSATVRRGPAGRAVDTFVHVFSSGGQ